MEGKTKSVNEVEKNICLFKERNVLCRCVCPRREEKATKLQTYSIPFYSNSHHYCLCGEVLMKIILSMCSAAVHLFSLSDVLH